MKKILCQKRIKDREKNQYPHDIHFVKLEKKIEKVDKPSLKVVRAGQASASEYHECSGFSRPARYYLLPYYYG